MKFEEYIRKRYDLIERMIWVGCNPDDPKMFKEQTKEGFKLMYELSNLTIQYSKELRQEKLGY